MQRNNQTFKLSLNKINIIKDAPLFESEEERSDNSSTHSSPEADEMDVDDFDGESKRKTNKAVDYEVYDLLGYLKFNLTFIKETNYVYFQLLNEDPNPQVIEPVADFLKLITRPEYVSLTFNDFFFDEMNQKLIFRPSIIPCYSYDFDYEGSSPFVDMIEMLVNSSEKLGYLTLRHLELELEDYACLENGNYKAALEDPDNVYDDNEGDYVLGGNNNYVYGPGPGPVDDASAIPRGSFNEIELGEDTSFMNSSQASISLLKV
ncbi:hypothetical protein WICPIJ_001206 [Wickerhamomyces pijperi]|uniref:Uncharacterized protein n=1 Tax=Wickerhamomyces pijperi TaxID=599730 RepID=A0A9P8TRI3_WICPI|nr:hypothetical protein WICPIJ_001206 [Wickerhamomyces pijperi]